jgi:hypothetical protein
VALVTGFCLTGRIGRVRCGMTLVHTEKLLGPSGFSTDLGLHIWGDLEVAFLDGVAWRDAPEQLVEPADGGGRVAQTLATDTVLHFQARRGVAELHCVRRTSD